MLSYFSAATEVKKRTVVAEERSVALFGSKPVNKKLRTKEAPLADGSNTASGGRE